MMDPYSTQIPVDPTRIGELGVGTFAVLVGGILFIFSCIAGAAMQQRRRSGGGKLCFISTVVYGTLIFYLTHAKRRSQWVTPDNVISDVDNLWLIHILVGSFVITGCLTGLVALFKLDVLTVIVAKEIQSERDRRWNGYGHAKFLF